MKPLEERCTVFTKPWKTLSVDALGAKVASLGFAGIELPVRPEFQVEPESMLETLPATVTALASHGVHISSVAGVPTREMIKACGKAGVPILRIMVNIPRDVRFIEYLDQTREEFRELQPLLRDNGVVLGIQNHCHRQISSVMGVRYLCQDLDPACVGIVLDFAHAGLANEPLDQALDAAWDHLCLVNFKNAYWRRINGPETEQAQWRSYWTSGRHGMSEWPLAVELLQQRGYEGDVCLSAEYGAPASDLERLIIEDLCYLRILFAR